MVEIDPSGGLVTVDNLQDIKLGSVFPKANLAWRNAFDWKGVHLSALVTARLGGVVYSATQAAMDQYGVSESSASRGTTEESSSTDAPLSTPRPGTPPSAPRAGFRSTTPTAPPTSVSRKPA